MVPFGAHADTTGPGCRTAGTDGTGRTSGNKAVPGASRPPGSADTFRRTEH